MTPIPGYIAVSFVPSYPGPHRVCWRIGTGAYTCIEDVVCTTDPCVVYIAPINFENEACDIIEYNGYVQASCESGLSGAAYWTQDFTPSPSCVPYTLTCEGIDAGGTVTQINFTANGDYLFGNEAGGDDLKECICPEVVYNTSLSIPPISHPPGYSLCGIFNGIHSASPCKVGPLNTNIGLGQTACTVPGGTNVGQYPFFCKCIYKPIVVISGGGGVGATAEAVIGYGAVTASGWNLISAGSGGPVGPITYNNVPAVNPITSPQGFGTQTFNVTVQGGKITNIVPNNNGRYFFVGETFTFNPALIGGCTGAVVQVSDTDLGRLIGLNITNPGSGYTSAPTVTLVGINNDLGCPGFPYRITTTANSTVDSSIGDCPPFYPGEGCAPFVDQSPLIPALPVGSTFNLCYPAANDPPSLTIPPSYTIEAAEGCCYDCIQIRVNYTGPLPAPVLPTLAYTECTINNVLVTQMTNTSLIINCVIRDSWVSNLPNYTTFTELGPCIT